MFALGLGGSCDWEANVHNLEWALTHPTRDLHTSSCRCSTIHRFYFRAKEDGWEGEIGGGKWERIREGGRNKVRTDIHGGGGKRVVIHGKNGKRSVKSDCEYQD